jgi:hypothetical protein
MKVWTIKHDEEGAGYTTEYPENFLYDIEEELQQGTNEYKPEDIKPFIESLHFLQPGQSKTLTPWTIECNEMTEDEFNNMSEFDGW